LCNQIISAFRIFPLLRNLFFGKNMINLKLTDLRKYFLPGFLLAAGCLTALYFFKPVLFSDFSVLFDLIVSFAIFSLYMNSQNSTENGYMRFTGISFFFYGTVEFIRILVSSSAGISNLNPGFPAPQLIFLGKCIRSSAFLAAPLLMGRRLSNGNLFAHLFLSIMLLAGLLLAGIIPGYHFVNEGLTHSASINGCIFAFSYLISLALLAWKRHSFPADIFRLLTLSLILFSMSELFPALNLSTGAFFLGNITNILALLIMSKAFLLVCFTHPFTSLFIDLEREKENFRYAADVISANNQNPSILNSVLDRNGNILSFNRACELATGYSEKDVKDAFVGDYFTDREDRESARRYIAGEGSRGLPFSKEICWKAKDGSPKVLKWCMQRVKDGKGELTSFICTGTDVTRYANTEKELHFKNLVLEQANDSILVHSPSGKILYENKAFLEQTGYKKTEINSLHFESIESAQSTEHNRHRLERLNQSGRARFESVFLKKDGISVQVEVSAAIVDMDGENLIVSVIRDNSARKLYQKKLKDRYVELSTLYRISATVSNSLTFDELFPKILDSIIELGMLDVVRRGGIFVPEKDKLKLVSFVGEPETATAFHDVLKIGDCLCGLAAKRGEIIYTKDIRKESRYCGNTTGAVPHGHMAIPLHSKNRLVGVMSLYLEPSSKIDESRINLLRAIGNQVAVALENAGLYEEMKNLALHDPLTGFANRRLMEIVFDRSMAEAKRFHEPLSVLMADIDFFKRYNDAYGHAAGDELLVSFARVLSDQVRVIDFVSRYGGEEFLVILPGTELFEACIVAERIRKQVEEMLGITVSLGAAAFTQETKNKEELIIRADGALYRAKQNGRNRIETAS
jgi:diguanylate cyclase (GGDEF)-like protein/PAS domain S-box-containing protein